MIIIAKEFKSKSEALNQLNASTSNRITLYEIITSAAIDEIVKLLKQRCRPCDILIFNR